ncbi:MAG: hypothetical protein V7K92_22775 [Nostoc sp.]
MQHIQPAYSHVTVTNSFNLLQTIFICHFIEGCYQFIKQANNFLRGHCLSQLGELVEVGKQDRDIINLIGNFSIALFEAFGDRGTKYI